MYGIIFIPIAEAELVEAWKWYGTKSPGLDWKFWDAVSATLNKVAKYPTRFTLVKNQIRVAIVKRFPYKIVYYINDAMQRIEVLAVIHVKRNPDLLKKRL
jgi:plasmid stabilization system protein ParE